MSLQESMPAQQNNQPGQQAQGQGQGQEREQT